VTLEQARFMGLEGEINKSKTVHQTLQKQRGWNGFGAAANVVMVLYPNLWSPAPIVSIAVAPIVCGRNARLESSPRRSCVHV
jgi:hypothetical protein